MGNNTTHAPLLSLLFSRLNSSSSFRLSLGETCSSLLMSFMLLAGLAPACPCPSCTAESSAGCSTPDSASPVLHRERSPPLACWQLSLMQARRLWCAFCAARVHYWLMFTLESTRTLRSLSVKLLCRQSASARTAHRAVLPQVQDLALPIVKLHEIPAGSFLQLVDVPLNRSTTIWCIIPSESPFGQTVCIGPCVSVIQIQLNYIWDQSCLGPICVAPLAQKDRGKVFDNCARPCKVCDEERGPACVDASYTYNGISILSLIF